VAWGGSGIYRLLELNHERYAAEVKAGLHDKRGRKRAVQDDSILF
jgi:hypothetical protein